MRQERKLCIYASTGKEKSLNENKLFLCSIEDSLIVKRNEQYQRAIFFLLTNQNEIRFT